MSDVILKMEGITKVFGGVVALENARFELKAGEVHALIGENGAGKSTLMKVLLGMHKRDGGTILYQDKEIEFSSPSEALNNGISMIHQEVNLVHKMSVAENIWLGREDLFTNRLGMIRNAKRMEMTRELLGSLEIDIPPKRLSRA